MHRIEKNNKNGEKKAEKYALRIKFMSDRAKKVHAKRSYRDYKAKLELIDKGELTWDSLKNNRWYEADKKFMADKNCIEHTPEDGQD